MLFWIIAIAISVAIAGLLAFALMQKRSDVVSPAAHDLDVYRAQLKEVDRDVARGVVSAEDAERVKTEVSRRILAADAQIKAEAAGKSQPRLASLAMVGLGAVLVLGGTFGAYLTLGAPGYRDLPLETRIAMAQERHDTRPSQSEFEAQLPVRPTPEVEADYLELIEKLRATVAERPDDLEGYGLLMQHEARLGNYIAAHQAQANTVRLKGDAVTADDYLAWADLMVVAAEGYVSPEAEDAVRKVLEINGADPRARYYWGLMLVQNDRPDLAFRMWEPLLRDSPPNAPWLRPIRSQIEEVAWRAGVDYTLPDIAVAPALPGPSAEDMEAAQDLSDEDRMAMIEGMVEGLADRLASEGGTPDEWARLITALGVLGRVDQATIVATEARQVFADNDAALALIAASAARAGIAQ